MQTGFLHLHLTPFQICSITLVFFYYYYSFLLQSYIDRNQTTYVSGDDPSTANWLRYINCPRHISEENTKATMCNRRVYYRTSVDIAPWTELLVYYGSGYAKKLGIDPRVYFDRTVCPALELISMMKPSVHLT